MKTKNLLIIPVIIFTITGCTHWLDIKHADKFDNRMSYYASIGNCSELEDLISLMNTSKYAVELNETLKVNYPEHRAACENITASRISKLKEHQAIKEQKEWNYIGDRAITKSNPQLAKIGNIVCTRFAGSKYAYRNGRVGKGAITNINENNYEVTYYSVHHESQGDYYGFEPGNIDNSVLPSDTRWYPLKPSEYVFYRCE